VLLTRLVLLGLHLGGRWLIDDVGSLGRVVAVARAARWWAPLAVGGLLALAEALDGGREP
jgi:hypothetical protein